LAQKSVGVFVGAAFPGCIGVREVAPGEHLQRLDRDTRGGGQPVKRLELGFELGTLGMDGYVFG